MAVRKTVECHIGAWPRTPYGPSRGNEGGGEKSLRHTLPVPFRRSPFGGWRHHLSPAKAGALWTLGSGVNLHVSSNGDKTKQPMPQARLACFPFARQGGSLVFLAHQLTSALAHYRGFIKTGAEGAHHNPRAKGPSNLRTLRTFGPAGPVHLFPLHPLNPTPLFISCYNEAKI